MERFCHSCGTPLADAAKFCASCGTQTPDVPAQSPPQNQPQYRPPISVNNASAKRTKRRIIIGVIMLSLGALGVCVQLVGLLIMDAPSIYDYSIFGNGYEDAVQLYQIAKLITAVWIVISFVVMLVGLSLVIINRRKTKEQ